VARPPVWERNSPIGARKARHIPLRTNVRVVPR
jgi:hypothetical protein